MPTCLHVLHAYVLTCLAYWRAHMPMCLACLRFNVPCMLTCSRANMPCMPTCSQTNVLCVLMCSNAKCLHTYVIISSFFFCIIVDTSNALGIPKVLFYCQILLLSSVFFLLYLDIREILSGSNIVESSFIKQLILCKNICENNIVFIVKLQIACINQALHS